MDASQGKDKKTPSEEAYDPHQDPDADAGELESREVADQPSQAEGEDDGRSKPNG